tara:strand:+ start:496 stop:819 length:324 start_codon:yes stop_codon:yes gene_type:complete
MKKSKTIKITDRQMELVSSKHISTVLKDLSYELEMREKDGHLLDQSYDNELPTFYSHLYKYAQKIAIVVYGNKEQGRWKADRGLWLSKVKNEIRDTVAKLHTMKTEV